MNLLKSTFLIIFLSLITSKSEATHVMGSDIFYRHLSGMKYEITLKFYRDCNGVGFANPSSSSRIRCVGGVTVPLTLSLKSITDITPICSSVQSPCDPANTFGTGDGMEEHVFVDTVDFLIAPFSNLLACGNELVIETGQCCRNSAISTGAANANFYTFAAMHFDVQSENNSTPIFEIPPIFRTVLNQPLIYTLGAMDTVDYDSLSFEFGNPLIGYNSNASFASGFSMYQPFDVYYPAGKSFPYNKPKATPPIGIHLDAKTGVLSATPTTPNQVAVLVIVVKEWRKDSTGVSRVISETRRDVQFGVESSSNNNVPQIQFDSIATRSYGASGCIAFSVKDVVNIPPPPTPPTSHDTLDVRLVGNNSHLTLIIDSTVYSTSDITTIVYGMVCYDSVWATNGDNSIYLYTRDDNCDRNAETSNGINIDFTVGTASSSRNFTKRLEFEVYPNPANTVWFMYVPKPSNRISITLIDVTGSKVFESADVYNQHISG